MSVVFSYEFSVPDELPPEFRELYGYFFTGCRKEWEKLLAGVVEQAGDRQKRYLGRVNNFHRSLLTESFQNWLSDSWGLTSELLAGREKELETFKKGSLLRTGTKIDAVMALMAAIRFHQVDEILKDLLHSLKAKPDQVANKELRIKNAIKRTVLSEELIMRGMVKSYGEDTDITVLLERRVHHKSIARDIVCCELEDSGCNLSSISGPTYITNRSII